MQVLTPVKAGEREIFMDVLRGFAILGIFIANLGAGLGLMGQIGPVYYTFLGTGFFIFQVIISTLWLKYFNYGPVEWLWRSATYKQWQAMLKK